MKSMHTILLTGLGIASVMVIYLLTSVHEGEEDWQQFVEANQCRSISNEDGSNRGGWRCHDGKIHYRWRQQK